jgi:hypothetical protein
MDRCYNSRAATTNLCFEINPENMTAPVTVKNLVPATILKVISLVDRAGVDPIEDDVPERTCWCWYSVAHR